MQQHIPTLPSDFEVQLESIRQEHKEIEKQHLRETSQHPSMIAWRQRRDAEEAAKQREATDNEFHSLVNFNQQGTLF